MTKIAPLPQPIFAIWFRFLAIFHQPWTPWPWWKIAKSVLVCSRWPVEAVLSKFSKNLPLGNFMFLLNFIVDMHRNTSEMNKNNLIWVRTHFKYFDPRFGGIRPRAISRASGCKIPALGKSPGPRGMYFPIHPSSRQCTDTVWHHIAVASGYCVVS